jgi:hypothetical protein
MDYPGRVIKIGEANSDIVTAIQVRINERGFEILEVNGEFNADTESAVKLFQSQSSDAHGIPLVVDGQLGPISWAALFGTSINPPAPQPITNELFAKVLEVANSQIGVLEDPPGSNRGAKVEEFLASAGCSPGDPWCASFVYWCFREASKSLNVNNDLPRTGSCMFHWGKTKAKKITSLDATNNPLLVQPGYVFIMDHGGGKGHTGIVTGVADGYIQTVEGNTNISGSREGLGVAALRRKINTISAGFIDYSNLG